MPEAPREVLSESVVTPPSDFCPFPERWTSTDDESTELEVTELIGALVRATQPDHVLETGTAFGQTTTMIAAALVANGHGDLHTVDLNAERQERVSAQMKSDRRARVNFITAHSEEWKPPCEFQFMFTDCDMRRRAEVFRHFRPWLPAGAIVAFHDMAPSFSVGPHAFGAGEPQLHPLVEEGLIRFITLRSPRGLSLAEVIA